MNNYILVLGGSGGIGQSVITELLQRETVSPQKRGVKTDQGEEGMITFTKDLSSMS